MKTPSLKTIAAALSLVSTRLYEYSYANTPVTDLVLGDNWYSLDMNWDLNIHFVEMFEKQQPHLCCDIYEYDWKKGNTNTQEWYTILAIQWEKEWNQ